MPRRKTSAAPVSPELPAAPAKRRGRAKIEKVSKGQEVTVGNFSSITEPPKKKRGAPAGNQNAKIKASVEADGLTQKPKRGRPSSKPKVEDVDPPKRGRGRPSVYQPEFVDQAKMLCELGATDDDVAKFFHVSRTTIQRWQIEFPDFCLSLKVGKETCDNRV